MLDKTYQPAEIEPRIRAEWERADAFKAGRPDRAGAQPYCIVIPPPNVTGSLHMGHALNNTLQDVLCRFERLRGKDVLWQPGTDHAGIATQMVVERQMMERQEPDRRTIGREAFVEKVWAWKQESGSTILNQLKRLGASCDWSRERFTMDEGLSKASLNRYLACLKVVLGKGVEWGYLRASPAAGVKQAPEGRKLLGIDFPGDYKRMFDANMQELARAGRLDAPWHVTLPTFRESGWNPTGNDLVEGIDWLRDALGTGASTFGIRLVGVDYWRIGQLWEPWGEDVAIALMAYDWGDGLQPVPAPEPFLGRSEAERWEVVRGDLVERGVVEG